METKIQLNCCLKKGARYETRATYEIKLRENLSEHLEDNYGKR